MKKIKSLVCILMAIMLAASCFAFSASAKETEAKDVTLHITKYQIAQMNGETDKIGNTSTLTGTTADAPQNASVLKGVEFTIFKLGELGTYVSDSQITAIDATYNSANKTVSFNGNTITGTSKTTDANGVADFTVSASQQGVYFVKETAAPEAVTAKAASFVVNLPMTNTDGNGFMYDVYAYPKNYTTLGGGILQKIDSAANKKLAGAKFALYKADGTQVTEDYYGNAIGDAANHYLTTDANGFIYVNNLLAGSYYFKETVAPDGYILKSDKYTFTVESGKTTEVVEKDGTLVYDGISLLTADNSGKPGVNKYVTEIGKKEDSVSFGELIRWYIVADVPSDMGAAYTKYELVDTMDPELNFAAESPLTVSISTDGTTYSTLAADKYTVSAVENQRFTVSFTDFNALSGAKKLQVIYKTKLNESTTVMGDDIYNNVTLNYATDVVNESAKESNPPKVYTGGFKFLKVSYDKTTTLAGARFDVYTDYDIKVATVISDSQGKFEVKGLTYGNYYLVETKAPDGYELNTAKIDFTVTKTSYYNTTPLYVTNIPTPSLPITGGMGTVIFTVAGFGLIALSAVFFVASKKSKKDNA